MDIEGSRRSFLKTGAGVCAAGSLLGSNLTGAYAMGVPPPFDLQSYFNHFGVDEAMIAKVISAALSNGGDFCDVYFQHNLINSISMEDNIVHTAYNHEEIGVGIRVVKGGQTGYSFTEDLTLRSMIGAARTAGSIAEGSGKVGPVAFNPCRTKNYYPIRTGWDDVSIDKKIPVLQRINDKMLSLDKRIVKSSVGFSNETRFVMIATSEGKIVCDYQPMVTINAGCNAEQNGQREQAGFGLSERSGFEYLTDENIDLVASKAVSYTVDLFDAVKPEGGLMPVVLAPGSSGILLHEAIGHGMEADFNRKGISIFSDKIGKPVAEDIVTIVDDGTTANSRGAINVDDEGNATGKTCLVENGILKSYLHDRISARHYKTAVTGNGRRQSFRHMPVPRMRNTYMLPGPHTPEEIIKSVKKGLYAETFANGQVDIGAGDFTFYVKSGRLIEDGKLTAPVKDINIIGNGPDVLSKIVMVADDLKFAQGGWTCGKGGQRVPVSSGLPTIKVSGITVGGV